MHLHAILIITSSFTPRSAYLPLVLSGGKFNHAISPIYPHATFRPTPRGAYGYFAFQILPPRYLWGLSKPPVGAYGPW